MLEKPVNTWIELDASALTHNIHEYKKIIPGELAFVVKGNAYGHGLYEIITMTKDNPAINWYCTFSLSEALLLRSLGVCKPILVLVLFDADIKEACTQQIDLVISDLQQLKNVHQIAKQHKMQARIHLKIDTGLSRFGFLPEEALPIVEKINTSPYLELRGICTHFAAAEQNDQSYTLKQIEQFNALTQKLHALGINIPYRHTSATSAVIRHHTDTNMARIGAGIYGLRPSLTIKHEAQIRYTMHLRQILSWKSYILSMRTIKKGASIGYGNTYVTQRETKIAIIPVGYADGYPRSLSNLGKVFINGHYASVLGKVAMNVITVDVTHIACKPNMEVTLMGNIPELHALDIAQLIGSHNPREITTNLSESMKRICISTQDCAYTPDKTQNQICTAP